MQKVEVGGGNWRGGRITTIIGFSWKIIKDLE